MSRANDEAVTFEDEDGEANMLSPEFATATMGHVLLGQGQRDAAREVFRTVLAKDPHDSEARRGMGLLGEPVSEVSVSASVMSELLMLSAVLEAPEEADKWNANARVV